MKIVFSLLFSLLFLLRNSEYLAVSAGQVDYRFIAIPGWHNLHIKETQLDILLITFVFNDLFIKKENSTFETSLHKNTQRRVTFRMTSFNVMWP